MRQNPHVRICGGPGSATTLVYPTVPSHRPHEFLDQFLDQLVVFESHPVAQGSQASRTQRRIGCHRAELLALPEAWHRDTPQASGHRRAGEHACGIINDRIEPYGGCKKILQGTHVFVVAGRHLG